MKQPEDQAKMEMSIPAKRGRPSTGRARTASQRKADQRARDESKVWSEGSDLSAVTTAGLIAAFERMSANHEVAKAAWLELGKRRGFIA